MIIIILLLAYLLIRFRYSNLKPKEKKAIAQLLLLFSAISISILIINNISINENSMFLHAPIYETEDLYGLDDQIGYYQAGVAIASGNIPISSFYNHHASVYYLWNGVVLATSPFYSILWPIFCNVILCLHLIFSLYIILRKNNNVAKTSLVICLLVAINGAIIFNSISNYKDILLSTLILGSILLWENYLERSRNKLQAIKMFLLCSLILILVSGLRVFAVFIILAINGYYLIYMQKKTPQKIVLALCLLFISFVFIYIKFHPLLATNTIDYAVNLSAFNYGVDNWAQRRPEISAMAIDSRITTRFVLGMVRFLFFPLPFSFLNIIFDQEGVFSWRDFWTIEVSIVWSLIWPLAFLALFDKSYWKNRIVITLFIWAISFLIIYSVMYLGSVDFRHKIPMFIFGTVIAVMKISESRLKSNWINMAIMIYALLATASCFWLFYGSEGI